MNVEMRRRFLPSRPPVRSRRPNWAHSAFRPAPANATSAWERQKALLRPSSRSAQREQTVCFAFSLNVIGGSQEIRNIVIVCSVMYLPVESGIETRSITEIVLSLGNSSYSQNSPFLSTFSTRASPRRFVSIMTEQAISPTP